MIWDKNDNNKKNICRYMYMCFIPICVIFQLQLTQSLTKVKREDTLSSKALTRQSTGIPLVRLTKDEVKHGLLTERQRTWADGFPNEPHIENPVLHKQAYLSRLLFCLLFMTSNVRIVVELQLLKTGFQLTFRISFNLDTCIRIYLFVEN